MTKRFYYLFIALLMLTACKSYRYVYAPSPAVNPFFTAKGDNQFALYYSGSGDNAEPGKREKNEGLDIQGAYAISDRVALTGSYYYRTEQDFYPSSLTTQTVNFSTSTVNYKRKLFDIGAGYFIPLDKKKEFVFNLYGGIGFGDFAIADKGTDTNDDPYTRNYKANMVKWYLQPSLNFFPAKHIRIGCISKFSFVSYNTVSTDYTTAEQSYFLLDKLPGKTIAFFEPGLNLQFSIPKAEWLKVESSFLAAIKWKENRPPHRSNNLSIGIAVSPFNIKK